MKHGLRNEMFLFKKKVRVFGCFYVLGVVSSRMKTYERSTRDATYFSQSLSRSSQPMVAITSSRSPGKFVTRFMPSEFIPYPLPLFIAFCLLLVICLLAPKIRCKSWHGDSFVTGSSCVNMLYEKEITLCGLL